MKICAIICEFNPFHNGHAYLINEARKATLCDALVCIMSGQFTQRGEICRTDKFLRAKHVILSGADAVVELPAPFAVAPAEVFARGGVKLASALRGKITLCFGCESGDKDDFCAAARILCDEDETFKSKISEELDGGQSYIKAYQAAFEACGGKRELLSTPNSILGVEYAKAVLRSGADIEILPIKRIGAGFNDGGLKDNFSSAGAIRANANNALIKSNMPECSYVDFISSADNRERFERLAADMLFLSDKENLKRVYGCSEGLENKLIACSALKGYTEIVEACTSKRYSSSRIKRIICANLLGLYADKTERFLQAELPHKILAVKKEKADEVLPLFKSFEGGEAAKECYELSSAAYALWRHLSVPLALENANEKMILV